MSVGQCQAANPQWHTNCSKRLIVDGNFFMVCDDHNAVVSLMDTWNGVEKDQIIRGQDRVAALGAPAALPVAAPLPAGG